MAAAALRPSGSPDPSATSKRIVLVMGPGRSGTSTIAGALTRSGLAVPGKAIAANETNPSGFYEPRWVVDFHGRLLKAAQVATLDSDPDAYDVTVALGQESQYRDELREWLAARLEEESQLVVKDPRTVWFRQLWVDTARDLGVDPSFVTMLRHPAEVSASRARYYAKDRDPSARAEDVTRIGGWVNVALTTERVTRDSDRVFVRYADLLSDWRVQLDRVETRLGLALDPSPATTPHPVDEFINPTLRRVQVEWDDVEVPVALRDLAERVWTALSDRAEEPGAVPDTQGRTTDGLFDDLAEEYRSMTRDAWALNRSAIRRSQAQARRQGKRQGRRSALEAQQAEAPERRKGLRLPWRSLRRDGV